MSPVDLSALAQRAITFVQPDADSQQIKLNLWLPESEVTLSADADLLQVLLNLLQNSLVATAAGGEIELGIKQQMNEVQLWVRDSGTGKELVAGAVHHNSLRAKDPFIQS